jgi:putative membrane protein insertion efficiency factor
MKTAFRWLIQFYRLFISPMLGPRCRFYPSCSVYALEALEQHSLGYALWLIMRRLGRCHPWGGSGYDPVPPKDDQASKVIVSNKNSVIKVFLIQFFNARQICHCHADIPLTPMQFGSERAFSQSIVHHPQFHQYRKFKPYTHLPHHYSLFI